MSRRAPSPHRRAQGLQPFIPTQLAGCVLWLRADLGITIGTGVSAWADQSGNGNNCSQGTGAAQPSYNASDANYNNRPTLSFDGTDDLLNGTTTINLAQPSTWYFVGQSSGGAQTLADGSTNRQFTGTSAGNWSIYAGSSQLTGDASHMNSPVTLCAVFSGASSALYVNSSSSADLTGNPGASSLDTYSLGAFHTGLNFLSGKLAEIIAYNSAHAASTRAQVIAYFASRYAIAAV